METLIGRVTHYYDRIGVAVLQVSGSLRVGDDIHLLGRTTDFSQTVTSMEIEHRKVDSVPPGTEVALRVLAPVRAGDNLFKVEVD